MQKHDFLAFLFFLCFFVQNLQAQNEEEKKYELAILAGTIQPVLLRGGNIELSLYSKKFVIDYSHGFALNLESKTNTTVGAVKDQALAVYLPYSTGFGIGYRFNRFFDVRFEPKMHQFEIYYDGENRKESMITDYQTFTLGLGAYFRWKPFEKQNNLMKNIFTSTSIRYWQNVASTLEGGELAYENKVTGQTETHETANIGIANTPWLFNLAVGYSVQF